MSLLVYSNNASTTIAAPLTAASTSISVTAGSGTLFPSLSAGQNFIATLNKAGSPGILEIILVTATATDTFTVLRGHENTTALAWNAGDVISLFPTAGGLNTFVQPVTAQAQSYNFAVDTGSANAYAVTLTPALTAHVVGAPIRWKAGHGNTAACTFNDGVATATLVVAPGVPCPSGIIIAGGIYTSTWDGTEFQLGFSAANYATTAYVNAKTQNTFSPLGNGYKIHEPDPTSGIQYIEQWGTQVLGAAGQATLNFVRPFNVCLNTSVTPVGQNSTYFVVANQTDGIVINFGANNTTFQWTAKGY